MGVRVCGPWALREQMGRRGTYKWYLVVGRAMVGTYCTYIQTYPYMPTYIDTGIHVIVMLRYFDREG